MTVSSTNTQDSYAGNGSTTTFPVTFKYLAKGDVAITLVDSDGVKTIWVLDTDYTLTAPGDSGTVEATVAPASGETLVINRVLALTQLTDYVENDEFPAESHEEALDRLTMIAQQQESQSAGIRPSNIVTDDPDLTFDEAAVGRANKIVGFDASGDVELKELVDLGTAVIGEDVQAYDANLPTWPATVDATEVGYLNGVTSSIQDQLNATQGPAFRAYRDSTDQNIDTGTWTKIQYNAESFDTDDCFDSLTNFRFTPDVEGYYQLNAHVLISVTTGKNAQINIYKNGSPHSDGSLSIESTGTNPRSNVSDLIYFNGTTDYAEIYAAHNTGSTRTIPAGSQYNYFSAVFVRGA